MKTVKLRLGAGLCALAATLAPMQPAQANPVDYAVDEVPTHSGASVTRFYSEDWQQTSGAFAPNQMVFAKPDTQVKFVLEDTARNIQVLELDVTPVLFKPLHSTPWDSPNLTGALTAKQAYTAYQNIATVYDFYTNLDRYSVDNQGSTTKLILNGSCKDGDTNNACWHRLPNSLPAIEGIFIGSQWSSAVGALDVLGHEYTHGVISYIVHPDDAEHGGLSQNPQAQALNEAYADIMGSLIEGKSGRDKWRFGEDMDSADLLKLGRMFELRSLAKPVYFRGRTTGESHRDSAYFSHAAYLMIVRSKVFSDDIWARIFYSSLYRLTQDATFLDARRAVISSAKAAGFPADKINVIENAFDDVGIFENEEISSYSYSTNEEERSPWEFGAVKGLTIYSNSPNQVTDTKPKRGTVTGDGIYWTGDVVTLSAEPEPGFQFDHWECFSPVGGCTDDSFLGDRYTDPTIDFKMPAEYYDVYVKAYFSNTLTDSAILN